MHAAGRTHVAIGTTMIWNSTGVGEGEVRPECWKRRIERFLVDEGHDHCRYHSEKPTQVRREIACIWEAEKVACTKGCGATGASLKSLTPLPLLDELFGQLGEVFSASELFGDHSPLCTIRCRHGLPDAQDSLARVISGEATSVDLDQDLGESQQHWHLPKECPVGKIRVGRQSQINVVVEEKRYRQDDERHRYGEEDEDSRSPDEAGYEAEFPSEVLNVVGHGPHG